MKSFLPLFGRLLMSALFLYGAYWHIANWQIALQKTAATGVSYPSFILVAATILLFAGALSLLLGYKMKVGVTLLLIEIIPTAFLFHRFWTLHGLEMQISLIAFLTKMALSGGLLFLLALDLHQRKEKI